MTSSLPTLHHWFTHFQTLGGVQSVLKRHLLRDPGLGFASSLTTFFDKDASSQFPVSSLQLTWRDTIASTRRKISTSTQPDPQSITVAHNLWGLTFWADLNPDHRRIGILHSDWPRMPLFLQANRGLLDGLLCVSPQLLQLASTHLSDLLPERLQLIPYPIANPLTLLPETQTRPLHPNIRVGLCGRVQRQQKRLDRLPALLHALNENGIPFQLECVGDGPDLASLKHACAQHINVIFHGRLDGDAYWNTITQWDVLLFLSDYEGLPIALLEGLSCGAIPLFPRINCGADAYVHSIHPSLLYEPGNLKAIADRIARLQKSTAQEIDVLRRKAIKAVQPHREENYFNTFSRFTQTILSAPRVSATRFPRRLLHWSDFCPFGLLSRIAPHAPWRSPLT